MCVDFDISLKNQIQEIEKEFQEYRQNVVAEKYRDNLDEFEHLLEKAHKAMDKFVEDHKIHMTPEDMERVISASHECVDYIENNYKMMKEIIGRDRSISGATADYLWAKNLIVKHMLLREEVKKNLLYIEKISYQMRTDYLKTHSLEQLNEKFVTISNSQGMPRIIAHEYAEKFESMTKMSSDLLLLLQQDLKKLQDLYNSYAEKKDPIDLGIISSSFSNEKDNLLSDEQLDQEEKKTVDLLHKLLSVNGLKEKIKFSFEGKEYTVLISSGQKFKFLDNLSSLAYLRSIKKARKEVVQTEEVSMKIDEDLVEVKIDHGMIETMTNQQATSYLQSIMLRIENMKSMNLLSVYDATYNKKQVPALYINEYEDCKRLLQEIAFRVDKQYLSTLSLVDKEKYYHKLMYQITKSDRKPRMLVNGVEIPIIYYKSYIFCHNALQSKELKEVVETQKRIGASPDPLIIEEKPYHSEYVIDEDYVKRLDEKRQLSYYANMIGKIASSGITPTVVYESFGVKLEIPVLYVTMVQECERRASELKETLSYKIDEELVSSKSLPEQNRYYRDLIRRISNSDKKPKITVDYKGMPLEIPEAYLSTYKECVNRLEELQKRIPAFQPTKPEKSYKVKKVRKPITQKVKDFLKKIPNRVKVALDAVATAATVVTSFVAGYQMGSKHVEEPVEAPVAIDISDLSSSYNVDEENINEANDKIDQWAEAVTQSAVSQFGTTFTLNENAMVHTDPYDLSNPKPIYSGFQKSLCSIVNISIKMPDGTIQDVNFTRENAQNLVNDLISQGGVVETVGFVAEEAEAHYRESGLPTGYITLDKVKIDTRSTDLSSQIMDYLSQGRSR